MIIQQIFEVSLAVKENDTVVFVELPICVRQARWLADHAAAKALCVEEVLFEAIDAYEASHG